MIEADVTIGPYVVFGPGVTVRSGAEIRAFCHIEGAEIGAGAIVGPFARLRPGAVLEDGVHIGNFVEVKNAASGKGRQGQPSGLSRRCARGRERQYRRRHHHLQLRRLQNKHSTDIGAGVFIGSNATLVAPVKIGDGAYVAAGSVITEDVEADALAFGRARQVSEAGPRRTHSRAEAKPRKRTLSMCGIIGIAGTREVAPLIVDALKRLEYRGYDSAGIATLIEGRIERRRSPGKLERARARCSTKQPLRGHTGIGHTRWATHGAPTERNAHPHASSRVALVHNGIIENFRELRDELRAAGHQFESETDTEVAVHLVTHYLDKGMTPGRRGAGGRAPPHRRLRAGDDLQGRGAAARSARGAAARWRSAMATSEAYLGSDAFCAGAVHQSRRLSRRRRRGRWSTAPTLTMFDDARQMGARATSSSCPPSAQMVDKGGHRHFMAKEIYEQPEVVGHTIVALCRCVGPDGRFCRTRTRNCSRTRRG